MPIRRQTAHRQIGLDESARLVGAAAERDRSHRGELEHDLARLVRSTEARRHVRIGVVDRHRGVGRRQVPHGRHDDVGLGETRRRGPDLRVAVEPQLDGFVRGVTRHDAGTHRDRLSVGADHAIGVARVRRLDICLLGGVVHRVGDREQRRAQDHPLAIVIEAIEHERVPGAAHHGPEQVVAVAADLSGHVRREWRGRTEVQKGRGGDSDHPGRRCDGACCRGISPSAPRNCGRR